jgi:hypothetical protein
MLDLTLVRSIAIALAALVGIGLVFAGGSSVLELVALR